MSTDIRQTEDTEEIEGPAQRIARRRRRAGVTLAVVCLLLFFAFWYAFSYYRAASEPRQVTTACPTSAQVRPADVSLNIYNATDKNGLAAKASNAMAARGFFIGTVANDPKKAKVPGVAQVRYGSATVNEARFVALHVPGATLVNDGRTSGDIDLVLGERFTAVKPPPAPSRPPGC
ncbi:MAG: LytR C-terminal domain-containing protein [Micrococcales bacterium]|nr:LytR C-terminal domain-containing protein [Micrococcales bacterium]